MDNGKLARGGVRAALEERLDDAQTKIAHDRAAGDGVRELRQAEDVIGPGEILADAQLAETGDALLAMHVRDALQLEVALHRLAEGRYGRCVDCDASIEAARLQANPQSVRCLACQERHEQRARLEPRGPGRA
jgi:RNA polymerase-binding transcription factor DksA